MWILSRVVVEQHTRVNPSLNRTSHSSRNNCSSEEKSGKLHIVCDGEMENNVGLSSL